MGYPILDGVATKLANLTHERLIEAEFDEPLSKKLRISDCALVVPPIEKLPSPGSIRLLPLERISLPSLERFQELLLAGRPFILTGGMTHWPACRSGGEHAWTLEYWQRKVGYRLVPIEIGSRYTDESWGQELMTINRFIERFILSSSLNSESNRPIGYLAQHQLFLQIPELADDVHTPDYCMINGKPLCEESCVDSNVWFGPANTVSPLHHDSERANLLAQVSGQKYVILFTASETPYLYAHSETMLCNTSQVDVEHPDLEAFPLLTNAQGFHGILSPGEMLFIPPRCWHYVRSLSLSFSVNFWWDVADAFIPSWSLAQSAFHGV
ncbi:unnamed protein product [Dicrocoelium dendriticum]|nr:unnamed protein product [Dicrocoelium dendriticum]